MVVARPDTVDVEVSGSYVSRGVSGVGIPNGALSGKARGLQAFSGAAGEERVFVPMPGGWKTGIDASAPMQVKIKMGGDLGSPQKADINANAPPQDAPDPWALPDLEDQGVKWSGKTLPAQETP